MVTTSPARFAFIGQHVALDFINTVEWRLTSQPHDKLRSYKDLVTWALEAGTVTEQWGYYLIEAEAARHVEAEAALDTARFLREAIYRIIAAAIARNRPQPADTEALNRMLREGLFRLKVTPDPGGYALTWALDDILTFPLWHIAWSAAQLLISAELTRVRQCASEDGCGWVFLDRSKNLSRRWCTMGSCGNTAKARRYRERTMSRKPST